MDEITRMKDGLRELKTFCGELDAEEGKECLSLTQDVESNLERTFGVDIEQDKKERDVMDELGIREIKV